MSSYFANSYIPDLRNGTPDHYAATAHQGVSAAQVNTDPSCDPSLRQGIPHHYGGPPAAGQPPPGIPYPRFPPYDRLDIRTVNAAGYYGTQTGQNGGTQNGMIVDNTGVYRSNSPTMGAAHMPPQQQQTPVQYTSCKLQAASVTQNVLPPESPPNHHQQQNHHMNHHAAQNHLMYNNVGQQQTQGPPQHHVVAPHQAQHPGVTQPPQQPPQQQSPPQNNNQAASLPSPLYPWMRSQFGKF